MNSEDSLFKKLHEVSTASLSSELLTLGYRNTFMEGVAPLKDNSRIVGKAFTLRYIPAREDLDFKVKFDNWNNVQRIAVEKIEEGEVLVIDARGETAAGSLGDILCTRIEARGAAGIVTDGALRDSPAIKQLKIPAYARAKHAAVSSILHHPVDYQVPIACGGVMVQPGDVIVGDAEGVIVIPSHEVVKITQRAYEREHLENWLKKKISLGMSIKGVYPPDDDILNEYKEWRKSEKQ